VSATRFRLCVPNEAVEQVKESLTALLSADDAYAWCQRPMAALRRGLRREVVDEKEEQPTVDGSLVTFG
jgi:hypothetical protein